MIINRKFIIAVIVMFSSVRTQAGRDKGPPYTPLDASEIIPRPENSGERPTRRTLTMVYEKDPTYLSDGTPDGIGVGVLRLCWKNADGTIVHDDIIRRI